MDTGHKKGKQKSENSLKVVYISSPMKVKTSASRFRSLVQQLTGKNSDVARYMEEANTTGATGSEKQLGSLEREVNGNQVILSYISDSLLGTSQMGDDQFAGILSCHPYQLP